jgi:hypothetical protein
VAVALRPASTQGGADLAGLLSRLLSNPHASQVTSDRRKDQRQHGPGPQPRICRSDPDERGFPVCCRSPTTDCGIRVDHGWRGRSQAAIAPETRRHARSFRLRTVFAMAGSMDTRRAAERHLVDGVPLSHFPPPALDSWLHSPQNDRQSRMNGLRGARQGLASSTNEVAMEDRLLYRVPEVAVILNISRSRSTAVQFGRS